MSEEGPVEPTFDDETGESMSDEDRSEPMCEDEPGEFSIAERIRSMAKEVGGSLERALDELELDQPAATFGVDPERAREWAESAGAWLRSHVEEAGDELASRIAAQQGDEEPPTGRHEEPPAPLREERTPHAPEESPFRTSRRGRPTPLGSRGRARGTGRGVRHPASVDPLHGAAPNPLDLPSTEQGQALAALDSGRWTVEPGTEALACTGEGPGPSDALGLVRELRVRDWITIEGKLTLTGRRALSRWLQAVS